MLPVPIRLLIIAVTVNAVIGQLLLKRAILELGGTIAFSNLPRFILAAARSPWIYASLTVQVLGYVLWMVLVSRAKLGVATASVGAGFYVLMAFCAWGVYGESLSYLQWLGIVFITIGVTCVGLGPA
jgi:drug/metabolite transporter (DMT)-like permease